MAQNPRPVSPWTTWLLVGAGALVLGAAFYKDRVVDQTPAPAVSLPKLGGGTLALQRGKVTVLDFWATWCQPCRATMPKIQRMYTEYQPKGVELLSVNTDDPGNDREIAVSEFLLSNRLTFPVALDDGSAQSGFKVANLPTLIVVGKDGKVAWRRIGALNDQDERDLRLTLDDAVR
ncbi:MAG: TlpA family protein disulfide reductase [Deltaproteobacteria bacterium]|nr:TlpA family protein disulfide reductase [Deltaproteobacteria bacterium]